MKTASSKLPFYCIQGVIHRSTVGSKAAGVKGLAVAVPVSAKYAVIGKKVLLGDDRSTPYGVRQESESWNGLAAVPPGRPRGFQYRVADSLVDDALVDDALVADSFVDDLGI
ncbi:hypothetical protein PG988_006617 [Apiospora saccharicola]